MGFLDWLLGRRHEQDQNEDLKEELAHWRIAEVDDGKGTVVVARVRIRRPELPDLEKYTTAVSISWPLDDDAPTQEVTAAMDRFEDSLEDTSDYSYLIQVRTGIGERNWLYYTSDRVRFMAELESRLTTGNLSGLSIVATEDPDWSEWRLLADRIS